MSEQPFKLCKDCKFATLTWIDFLLFSNRYEYAKCLHSENHFKIRLTDGRKEGDLLYCRTERSDDYDETFCGVSGRFWESKNV